MDQQGPRPSGGAAADCRVASHEPVATQVLPCSIRHVHDWSSCNFTHPGEKARRRDPQTHSYTGIACPDMKKVSHCAIWLCEGCTTS